MLTMDFYGGMAGSECCKLERPLGGRYSVVGELDDGEVIQDTSSRHELARPISGEF